MNDPGGVFADFLRWIGNLDQLDDPEEVIELIAGLVAGVPQGFLEGRFVGEARYQHQNPGQ